MKTILTSVFLVFVFVFSSSANAQNKFYTFPDIFGPAWSVIPAGEKVLLTGDRLGEFYSFTPNKDSIARINEFDTLLLFRSVKFRDSILYYIIGDRNETLEGINWLLIDPVTLNGRMIKLNLSQNPLFQLGRLSFEDHDVVGDSIIIAAFTHSVNDSLKPVLFKYNLIDEKLISWTYNENNSNTDFRIENLPDGGVIVSSKGNFVGPLSNFQKGFRLFHFDKNLKPKDVFLIPGDINTTEAPLSSFRLVGYDDGQYWSVSVGDNRDILANSFNYDTLNPQLVAPFDSLANIKTVNQGHDETPPFDYEADLESEVMCLAYTTTYFPAAQSTSVLISEVENDILFSVELVDHHGNRLWSNKVISPFDPPITNTFAFHTYTTADSTCIVSGQVFDWRDALPGNEKFPFVAIVRDGSPVQNVQIRDSAVTSRDDPAEAFSDLRLWPNPATDELHLDGDWPGPATARLLDATGRRLLTREGLRPGALLPLPDRLAAGLYLLELRSEAGTAHRRVMLR